MPNAVGSLIAQSDLKDLGVHTEMYVDAFVDIAKAGKITGLRKTRDKGRQVYAFGSGTKKLYDYLNENPECMSAPVNYTNDMSVIASIDKFHLYKQCCRYRFIRTGKRRKCRNKTYQWCRQTA